MVGMVEGLKGEKLGEECGVEGCYMQMILFAGSEEDLQRMLNVVGLYAGEWKFRFDSKKSKVMVLGRGVGRWKLCGKELEVVDSVKYLGVWIDRSLRGNVHMEQMVEEAEE